MSNYTGGVKNRRTRAITRLEAQLKSGIKMTTDTEVLPDGKVGYLSTGLSDKDRERIEKELSVLKNRI